jgi:hypothetical protein
MSFETRFDRDACRARSAKLPPFMPATAYALLLLVASVGLGVTALVRRSRSLGIAAAVVFGGFLAYAGALVLFVMKG